MKAETERFCLMSEGTSRYEDRKSVFLGFSSPVKSEEEAKRFLEKIRHEYADANHHVFAYYLLENQIMRYSDDGEPQGTAGLPALNVLKTIPLQDAAVAVVRYFGGTLLGTGGLTRAYGAAAKEAVENGGVGVLKRYLSYDAELSYQDYTRLASMLSRPFVRLDDTSFAETVRLCFSVYAPESEKFMEGVSELTGGRVIPTETGTVFIPVKK